MNEYRFRDLAVGMKEEFQREITADMMDAFCRLTGDVNPLHVDAEYASKKGFPDRVVYGMLTASLVSMLGGVLLPGKYCLLQGVDMKFIRPVYIGDVLRVQGQVSEIYEHVNQVIIKVVIKNQKSEKVSQGTIKAGILDE